MAKCGWLAGAGLIAIAIATSPVDPVARASAQTVGANRAASGVVQGRVTAADTGRPVVEATVSLFAERQGGNLAMVDRSLPQTGLGGEVISVATDADGRYEFRSVSAGRYKLQVSKAGYIGTWFGQRSQDEPARWIVIADGQPAERVDVAVPRGAVIVATITDDLGEPLAGVRVAAEHYKYTTAGRRLVPAVQRNTDDRGRVRLAGLQAGSYYVSATTAAAAFSGRDSGKRFVRTMYPAALAVTDAQPVQVVSGQEAMIGFSLAASGTYRISGTIVTSAGAPYTGRGALLRSGSELLGRGAINRQDGTFEIRDVQPGRYVVDISPAGGIPTAGPDPGADSGPPPEYARVPIDVAAAHVSNLLIRTSPGGRVRGRLVFDGGGPPADFKAGLARVFTSPDLPEATSGTAPVRQDATFELAGILGPRLFRARFDTDDWFLSAVVHGGRDITDVPITFDGPISVDDLQIHVTRQPTVVSGAATDDRGTPSSTYAVVVFSEDRDRWTLDSRFVAAGRPDSRGRYRIAGLPPGRYLAAAIDFLADGEETDPDLLTALAVRAERVTLEPKATRELTLKVVSRR